MARKRTRENESGIDEKGDLKIFLIIFFHFLFLFSFASPSLPQFPSAVGSHNYILWTLIVRDRERGNFCRLPEISDPRRSSVFLVLLLAAVNSSGQNRHRAAHSSLIRLPIYLRFIPSLLLKLLIHHHPFSPLLSLLFYTYT